jgi:hypothetical protein
MNHDVLDHVLAPWCALIAKGRNQELTDIKGTLLHVRYATSSNTGAPVERIHITQHTSLGAAWFVGWLFTIGYLHLDFWMGLLGLFIWPYLLGGHFATPAT